MNVVNQMIRPLMNITYLTSDNVYDIDINHVAICKC